MGGLRFGTDGDGNGGYYKADDSFVPFKKSPEKVNCNANSVTLNNLIPNAIYCLSYKGFVNLSENIYEDQLIATNATIITQCTAVYRLNNVGFVMFKANASNVTLTSKYGVVGAEYPIFSYYIL